MGIGRHTRNVLSLADYTSNPMKAADIVWRLSGGRSAANGALMRTSVIGIWPTDVELHATDICRLTHTDPRCVGSCVILSELIRALIWESKELDFRTLVEMGRRYDTRIEPYLTMARDTVNISGMYLDSEEAMGYTLKTLSAAVWCLYHVDNFCDGLLAVVNAGGDADTNAAVACGLLGAKYGFGQIPSRYVDTLYRREELEEVAAELVEILAKHSRGIVG